MEFIIQTESDNSIFKQNGFPELIRCKDCKHHGSEDCPLFTDAVEFVTDDDWFCADGQKEDDEDG